MQQISLTDLIEATGGTLVAHGSSNITTGVVTDTRALREGCLFVALVGERFDGNAFAPKAAAEGAAAVLISRRDDGIEFAPTCSVILVEDTLLALQKLAAWWRTQLDPILALGLTGSSGKTSTKDMLRAVLAQRMSTQATLGNLNNHIGVPLSILSTQKGTQCAVWEMGMNHIGELAPLCELTRPQMGIITTIGSAHIEFMGSRESIAHEKCTLARALPASGCMIYPAHDDYADYIAAQTDATPIAVGAPNSCVRALNPISTAAGTTYTLHIDALGEIELHLPIPGAHMVSNSLLAAAAGWQAGCSLEQIAAGLAEAHLTHGRLDCREINGYLVVDDTYNANPESMLAALETVATLEGTRRGIAVLGPMGELGEQGIAMHEEIGRRAVELGYTALVILGTADERTAAFMRGAAGISVELHATPEAATTALRGLMHPGDALLFKGSRSAGVERVLQQLFPTNPS